MNLRLTVRDSSTNAAQDVEISADPDGTTASLLAALPIPVRNRHCYVGQQWLDPGRPIGDSPLVPGAVISIGGPGPDARQLPYGAVGALRVMAGPDAGTMAWLAPGVHSLGRFSGAAVALHDPDVSRQHGRLDVSASGEATFTDIGSANGSTVRGKTVTGPTSLAQGDVLVVGDDVLEWVPRPPSGVVVRRSRDARLDFDRAFAPTPAIPRTEVVLPAATEPGRGGMANLALSAGVPLALGVVMALVLRQPALLLVGLFAPVSAFGTHLVERRSRRSGAAGLASQKAAATGRAVAAAAEEERLRRLLSPDQVDLALAAIGARRGLWPRNADSPDGLVLRVGTTDQPASTIIRGEPWPGFTPPLLHGVPVTLDLRATGVFGVVGPPDSTHPLMRWLLVQLGVLRSPDDLSIVLITSGDEDSMSWAVWLPHVDAGDSGPPCWIGNTEETRAARVDELRKLVATRMAERQNSAGVRFGSEVVVVLTGALGLRHLPGMREVLRDGPSVGVSVICVDRQGMNECRGQCEVDGDTLRLTRDRNEHPLAARSEGVDPSTAEWLARAVAPMRDRLTLAAAESAVPYPVRFLDLVGIGRPTAEDVLGRWKELSGPTTDVPLGADGAGIVTVDLAWQGPHTMLAGAPGAGKSILLQTLVTSLLLANRPDELNLVLVDFKGGSAFLPFERCPHVVSLIRSTGDTAADVFDSGAAARVLASVRAEVQYRESMLARYGGEIDEYWAARGSSAALPALPRLVMIFDEFARVLEVSPDFLKELVNVAAKGRSLGMHLVLATQSLQGKLSPELKNNIDLRITLRQNEAAESVEVLGTPDAVAVPGRFRGRGLILCTKDEIRIPRLFQSGYLGDPPPAGGTPPARVRMVSWSTLGLLRPEEGGSRAATATDQALVIGAIEDAAQRLGLPAPRSPLLPPLPAVLPLSAIADRATVPAPATAIPYGLADDPAGQAQPEAALDLAGTERLMVAGGPQSGRTTAARSLISSLVTRFRPDQAHFYVVEQQPAELGTYAGLPHCGGVFAGSEPDRIRRFVTWLDGEVQRRTAARFMPQTEPTPWIVLLIDGWEYFENRSDPSFVETSQLATLRRIITAGVPVGVHVVPIGGQDMLNSRLPQLYSQRLLLPFPKEETRRQHLTSAMISPPVLRGRAIEAATGHHVQVGRPSAPAPRTDGADRPPRRFSALPVRIAAAEVPASEGSRTWIPMGVGGPELGPIGVDLFDAGPHTMLVSGPSGSGRTTAVATVALGLYHAGVGVLAVAPPRSPLRTLLPPQISVLSGTTISDAALREAAAVFGAERYAVVVDDCEQIVVTPSQDGFADAPTLLQEIAGPGAFGRQALVLVGDATLILSGQRRSLMRVVTDVLSDGTKILLTPTSPPAAREHGFVLEPDQYIAGPPGRGYVLAGRTPTLLHLAMPA